MEKTQAAPIEVPAHRAGVVEEINGRKYHFAMVRFGDGHKLMRALTTDSPLGDKIGVVADALVGSLAVSLGQEEAQRVINNMPFDLTPDGLVMRLVYGILGQEPPDAPQEE